MIVRRQAKGWERRARAPWGPRAALGLALCAAAALSACSGGGGGAGAPLGTRTILTTGGAGTFGDGGDGGGIAVVGPVGGPVRILRGGAVDASFNVPRERPELGQNPRVITADTSIRPVEGTIPGGVDPLSPATGLEVRAGARLTIETLSEDEGTRSVELTHGLIVAGELRTGSSGLEIEAFAGIRIEATGAIICARGRAGDERGELELLGALVNLGTITFRGADGEEGGPGGSVEVAIEGFAGLFNVGTIDVSGGNGADGRGGDAGSVELIVAAGGVFHSGTILATGGVGSTSGGSGGEVLLGALQVGGVACSGGIDVSGGAGGGGIEDTGGRGGFVQIQATGDDARIAGVITARGGAGPVEEFGLGGDGGTVVIEMEPMDPIVFPTDTTTVREGSIRVGADIDTRGGSGGEGGSGGPVFVVFDSAAGLEEDTTSFVLGREVLLAGYARIDVSGGASTGGSGGDAASPETVGELTGSLGVLLDQAGVLVRGTSLRGLGGDVRSEVPITGRGGDAAENADGGGEAGSGAIIDMGKVAFRPRGRRRPVVNLVAAGEGAGGQTVESLGRIDVRGGDGVRGGRGGALGLSDPAHIVSDGEVLLGGGGGRSGSRTEGGGGDGGAFLAITLGLLESRTTIQAPGGAAPGESGGRGGLVCLLGGKVRSTGLLQANGGDGEFGGAGGATSGGLEGRVGGLIDILFDDDLPLFFPFEGGLGGVLVESFEAASRISGTLSARGGGGTLDGAHGEIVVDGLEIDAPGGAVGR